MHYHIIAHDNRGDARHPFGRIYLATKKNGECVGSLGFGAHRDNPDPYAVWPTHDTPQLGRDHTLAERAREMLRKTYPEAGHIE